jgi:hypothetical protein
MFDKLFRIETLNKIIAQAGIVDSLKQAIDESKNKGSKDEDKKPPEQEKKDIPNKPQFVAYNQQPFSITVAGASVWVPTNPIIGGVKKTDTETGKETYSGGKYNVFIWVRPGNISSGGKMKPTLTNAIVVTVDAGGMASSENSAKYGNSAFVKNTLATIDKAMKTKFGDVSLGNMGLASFSGGYGAIGKIINEMQTNPQLSKEYKSLKGVMVLDGLHDDPGGAFTRYAKEASQDPNKKFVAVYSQIKPGRMVNGKWVTYKSAKEAAEEIAKTVNAKTEKGGPSYGTINPDSISSINGVKLISAFSPEDAKRPARKYDPVAKKYVGPLEGTQEGMHVEIAQNANEFYNEFADSWNI